MDLPLILYRHSQWMQLYAIDSESLSFVSRKSGLGELVLSRKSSLGDHVPLTWICHSSRLSTAESNAQLEDFIRKVKSNPSSKFYCKTDGTSRGRGVKLICSSCINPSFLRIGKKTFVGQEAIAKPALIPALRNASSPGFKMKNVVGYKWDARVYVLILRKNSFDDSTSRGNRRWQAFLYKDGFARRCAELFSSDRNNKYSHISNTAVNSHLGDIEIMRYACELERQVRGMDEMTRQTFPSLIDDIEVYEEELRKRIDEKEDVIEIPITSTLAFLWKYLLDSGAYSELQIEEAQSRMVTLCKILFSTAIEEGKKSKASGEKAKSDQECTYSVNFSLLGVDIIFDDQLKPYVLEVNAEPDLRCYSMDQLHLKQQLVYDTISRCFPDARMPLSAIKFCPDLYSFWNSLNPSCSASESKVRLEHQASGDSQPGINRWELLFEC